jgi:hypothetical protein
LPILERRYGISPKRAGGEDADDTNVSATTEGVMYASYPKLPGVGSADEMNTTVTTEDAPGAAAATTADDSALKEKRPRRTGPKSTTVPSRPPEYRQTACSPPIPPHRSQNFPE